MTPLRYQEPTHVLRRHAERHSSRTCLDDPSPLCQQALIGADLRGVDLRRACFRGAYLIGADLRRADLGGADLLGADLRAADLRGAGLRDCLFLTRPQLEAAVGDDETRLSESFGRPAHW